MAASHWLSYVYLAYFSKPVGERVLYRAVRRGPARRIVELGVGQAIRSQRLLKLAASRHQAADIRYTGVDLFEARPAAAGGLPLKQAFRLLQPLAVKTQLVPGDPFSALARRANSLANTDLLIISADQQGEALERAWFYVPRMLHAQSQVFLETGAGQASEPRFVRLSLADLECRAGQSRSKAA